GQSAEPLFVPRYVGWNGVHGGNTSLHILAKPAARRGDNPRQPDELVHAPGEQRQPQAFQPGAAVAVAVPVREAIGILTVLPLTVKSSGLRRQAATAPRQRGKRPQQTRAAEHGRNSRVPKSRPDY